MTNDLAMGGALYDFEENDFGTQPDYDKDFVEGKVLIISGVSEATFEGDFAKPARSLLHNLPLSWSAGEAPFGLLMQEDSPAIQQASAQQEKGKVPFVARLRKVDSQRHKGQSYWTLEKAPSLQYDEHGILIDPNAPAEIANAKPSANKG